MLDGRRFLKTKGVDAAQDFLLKPHVVKIINFKFPVRFENFFRFLFLFLDFLVFCLLSTCYIGGSSILQVPLFCRIRICGCFNHGLYERVLGL